MRDAQDQAFDQYRQIIGHEDGLTDKRIGWVLAFNGLLFAAYGLSLSAEVDLVGVPGKVCAEADTLVGKIETLRNAISVAGVLSCVAAMIGVTAAMRAIAYAKNDYETLFIKWDGAELKDRMIAIAGSRRTFFWGMFYGLSMPALVAVPWLYILLAPDATGVAIGWECRIGVATIGPLLALGLAVCSSTCRVFDNGATPHLRFKTGKAPASKGQE